MQGADFAGSVARAEVKRAKRRPQPLQSRFAGAAHAPGGRAVA